MSDIQVFDKLLPAAYSDQIERDFNSLNFPWHYVNDVTNFNYGDNSGFVHLAYDLGKKPSEWYPFLLPIVYHITEASGHPMYELLRIRVGFLPQTTSQAYTHNTPHVDFTVPHYTACYYVNDTDGDTVLFDQMTKDMSSSEISQTTIQDYVANTEFTVANSVAPKRGSACFFNGLRYHSSTKPKLHEKRMVITVNYVSQR